MPARKTKLQVTYPGGGELPKDYPVLEYKDGLKFYEGDVWIRPPQTTPEIEQSLIRRGYLVEGKDG